MAAYEVLLLNTAVPQIQAAQSGDTYVVPRDIAFSAALTLSAGTANGVPYLNGSKVLTSGSALTFDGTKFGINGGIIADNNLVAQINSPSTTAKFIGFNRSGDFGLIIGYDNTANDYASIRTVYNYPIVFSVSNTEQMRLTSKAFMVGYTDDSGFSGQYNAAFSGNVGIGTSSPSENLDVSAAINGGGPTINVSNTYYAASSTDEFAEFQAEFYQNDVAARRAAGYMRFGKSGDFSANASASTFLAFATRNAGTLAERLRITSDGYLRMASGTGGIQFNGDTAAANALDDYEEGTWTPIYSPATAFTGITYDAAITAGKYTKIGNLVVCAFNIRTSSISGGSGQVKLGGLPFTAATVTAFGVGGGAIVEAGNVGAFAGDVPSAVNVIETTTTAGITYRATANGNTENLDVSDLATGAASNFIYGTFFYYV